MPASSAHEALPRMTALPEKARLYLSEVWFREAWEDLIDLAGERAPSLTHEHALLLFKPEAFVSRRVEETLAYLAADGFQPVAAHPVEFNRHMTRALWLYRFNVATVARVELHDLIMCGGTSLVVLLHDEQADEDDLLPATVRLTAIKGPSRPERRRSDHLRTRLGVEDRILNLFHSADEPADLVRELGLLLTRPERMSLIGQVLDQPDSVRIHEVIARLQSDQPARQLDLDSALEGILETARQREQTASTSEDRQCWRTTAELAEVARGGRPEARRALWGILLEVQDQVDRWDLATVGSRSIDYDELPDGEQTLGDAPPTVWRTRGAPVA
jgi:nucleoside diphosphate kinase